MLVLTRKSRDTIRIGDNVTVTILRVKGNTVRVGIEAPREIRVVRGELPDDFKEGGATEPEEEETSESPLAVWRHSVRSKSRTVETAKAEAVITPEMMAQYCA